MEVAEGPPSPGSPRAQTIQPQGPSLATQEVSYTLVMSGNDLSYLSICKNPNGQTQTLTLAAGAELAREIATVCVYDGTTRKKKGGCNSSQDGRGARADWRQRGRKTTEGEKPQQEPEQTTSRPCDGGGGRARLRVQTREGAVASRGRRVGGYVPGKAGVVCPRGVKGGCCIANWWSLLNC